MAQAAQPNMFQRMFKGRNEPNNQQQNQQQQQDPNQQQQQRSQPNNDGGGPSNNNPQGATNDPNTQKSPLDAYAKLWENIPDNEAEVPRFNIAEDVINKSAGGLDFTRNLPDELREAVGTAFGEHAGTVEQLLNHIGRQIYATGIKHTSALTDKYLDVRKGFDQKGLGRTINEHMALTSIDGMEAAKKSPIVREHLKTIGQRLARQYPDATPSEIQDLTQKFFLEMAQAISPKNLQAQQEQDIARAPGGADFNWDDWASNKPPAQ
jgi:hypothetical protein